LSICYLFWLNSFWGVNLIYFELEYNIVYLSIISGLVNFFIILTGVFSLNKYATVAALRTVVMLFCLELLLGLFLLNVVIYSNSFNFSFLFTLQEELPLIGIFFFASSVILIVVLMEVNRAPFDLNEAESELVSGYHVEYGAFFFGLFYLGEYFHLFFFSVTITILLTGF
jgi:NADH-quinone oxidoreductase subunit H